MKSYTQHIACVLKSTSLRGAGPHSSVELPKCERWCGPTFTPWLGVCILELFLVDEKATSLHLQVVML